MSGRVRLTIEGERTSHSGNAVVRVKYGPNASVLVDTTHDTVTVEDIVPPRVWTDGDVVQEVASDRVWRRVHREDGQHAWSNGFLAVRTDHAVSALVARGDNRVLRYQAGEDR